MRMAGECFNRRPGLVLVPFQEEGRGLGFSVGGWHPFRANTYLPTLKKLDPLANTSLGKAIWKPLEKANRSINKDFAKAKKWSQDHRKQLQIAAAVAAMAVGGAYYMGYLGTSAGAGAAGTAGTAAAEGVAASTVGAESVVATTSLATETLAPLGYTATANAAASGLTTFVPATVGTTAAQTATAGSILSTLGKGIATTAEYGKTGLTTFALLKAAMGGQAVGTPVETGAVNISGFGGGGYSGGGGGGFLGPSMMPGDVTGQAPAVQPDTLPPWALPAAGIGLLLLLTRS